MLRYYSTYQYDSGPYKEEEYYPLEDELFDDDEDDELNTNHKSCSCNDDFRLRRVTGPGWHQVGTKTMNRTTIITTMFVCVIPPILMQELAVVII